MEADFYGIKIDPPTLAIARAFGSNINPVLLEGGQGTSYRSGNIVLKPARGPKGVAWDVEVFTKLPDVEGVLFPKPIRAIDGTWSHQGYVAWTFIAGEHMLGKCYAEKLEASRKFHNLLKDIPKPSFLEIPKNSWAVADKVAWQEEPHDYDEEFLDLINQILPKLQELDLEKQVVHGDLSGNFLISPNAPVAIIDFSPAWGPNGFAEGIMLADAITWENIRQEDVEIFKKIKNIEQFTWRGILRRIVAKAEHMKWFNQEKELAVRQAREYQKAIDYLNTHF